jgi:rare lipoprotein A
MNALTAAHRTLPFNSVVRVTNLSSGNSVTVRITDRGPFVGERVIDLSLAAAKRVDVWRAGTARVKIEVLSTPVPISSGGRWAVQIGGFQDPEVAARLKNKLERRYRSARVLQVPGVTNDWWIRVRVLDDDKERAEEVVRDNHAPQGGVYLVRLD